MLLVTAAGCELPWDCGGAASSRDTDQPGSGNIGPGARSLRKSIQQQATDTFLSLPAGWLSAVCKCIKKFGTLTTMLNIVIIYITVVLE